MQIIPPMYRTLMKLQGKEGKKKYIKTIKDLQGNIIENEKDKRNFIRQAYKDAYKIIDINKTTSKHFVNADLDTQQENLEY